MATGDVNADGAFDVADVILLQKWLLAVPDVTLPDSHAADLYADDQVDVIDLGLAEYIIITGRLLTFEESFCF